MNSPSKSSGEVGKQQAKKGGRKEEGRKNAGTALYDWFIAVFGVAFLLSFSLNMMHLTMGEDDTNDIGRKGHSSNKRAARAALHQAMGDFRKGLTELEQHQIKLSGNKGPRAPKGDDNQDSFMKLATLDCKAYGGPSEEAAQEMVYWQDIPTDSAYAPPFFEIHRKGTEKKYLTFEPDGGGWNNIRMAMESTIALAVAMGRTLVMPPQKKMYLLGKNNDGQRHHFSFVDFFPIAEMAEDNKAFEVISMKEYLEEEAMKGKLINRVCNFLSKMLGAILVAKCFLSHFSLNPIIVVVTFRKPEKLNFLRVIELIGTISTKKTMTICGAIFAV